MNGRAWRAGIVLAPLAALGGCGSLPEPSRPPVANVDVALVPPPAGAARLQLAASQAFVYPQRLVATMPTYPDELLALRLPPQILCVDVDIDAEGAVARVAAQPGGGCGQADEAHRPHFAAALEEAVRAWSFDPALVCRTPDGRDSEDACAEPDALESPVALRLSYAFEFSQQDGTPRVELASGAR